MADKSKFVVVSFTRHPKGAPMFLVFRSKTRWSPEYPDTEEFTSIAKAKQVAAEVKAQVWTDWGLTSERCVANYETAG